MKRIMMALVINALVLLTAAQAIASDVCLIGCNGPT